MRKFAVLLLVCLTLAGLLPVSASAESAATQVELYCTVNAEGDCLVTMQVMLRLEQNHENLQFPLPPNARSITLGGSNVNATRTEAATLVDIRRISDGYMGDATLRFEYVIPEAVKVDVPKDSKGREQYDQKRLLLTLPLLSGFELPVERLKFTVTMPAGRMTERPSFTSIYRQGSVEADLTILPITGSQIIGSTDVVMNDREGITMTMVVPDEMFPTVSTYVREGNPELTPILVFAGLAMLYWLLTLGTWPLIRRSASTSPEGVTAGELGCRLTITGADLTMMVFTWAQMGYLLISLDGNGRVILHKRMDMGNERGPFENKIYRMLFGSRRMVDATGVAYAKLARKMLKMVPNEKNVYKHSSGNIRIFRGLACVCQIFCGICVAMNMSPRLPIATVMAVILGLFGAVSGWLIQGIAYRTHLRGKIPVLVGLVCVMIWILLGILCGQPWIPLGVTLGQWLLGFFAAYGGRRSDLGRHDAGQVLGLRHYLKHLPKGQLNRLLMNDPDYFFNMAPYALAMGVVGPYSRAFGQREMDQCPYLFAHFGGKRTAQEWGHLMADTADLMDAKSRRMELEKWLPIHIDLNALRQAFVREEPKKKRRRN